MNVRRAYCTVEQVKQQLNITATTYDADLLRLIESVSADVDDHCNRHFHTVQETRDYDVARSTEVEVDEFLEIASVLADSVGDGTFSQTLVENTDFVVEPWNEYPKQELCMPAYLSSTTYFPTGERKLRVNGTWGYGDGIRQEPWDDAGVGVQCDASSTTVTADATGLLAGQTIRVSETAGGTTTHEQMLITSVSGTTLTVVRGVNGTTAAAHGTAEVEGETPAAATYSDAYIAAYPQPIITYAIYAACKAWEDFTKGNIDYEMIGSYQYRRQSPNNQALFSARALRAYRRMSL